jgi:hypothetical protein
MRTLEPPLRPPLTLAGIFQQSLISLARIDLKLLSQNHYSPSLTGLPQEIISSLPKQTRRQTTKHLTTESLTIKITTRQAEKEENKKSGFSIPEETTKKKTTNIKFTFNGVRLSQLYF